MSRCEKKEPRDPGRKRGECLPRDSVRLNLVMQDIEREAPREKAGEGGWGQILGGFTCHTVEVILQEIIEELLVRVKQESLGLDISTNTTPAEKGKWEFSASFWKFIVVASHISLIYSN